MAAVEPAVEPTRPLPYVAHELLREARRLQRDGLPHLAAGGDLADRAPQLVAGDDLVDELAGAWARERLVDHPVERAGARELGCHPLQHSMLDE